MPLIPSMKLYQLAVATMKTAKKTVRSKEKTEVGSQRSEIGRRKENAAMNCRGRRNFGERSNLSPKKLIRAIQAAGIHKVKAILINRDDKIKAARIPIPPPLGVGLS